MNSTRSIVHVTITDYVTVYPTPSPILTSVESFSMATQPTPALDSDGKASTVTDLESFPIVAPPTLDRTTGRTSAASFHSTLQTSVRSSVSSMLTATSISSSSLSVSLVSQTSSLSTHSLANALPTGWPKPSAAPQTNPEKHTMSTVTILLISLFVALAGLLFLVALYLLRKGVFDDWRRKAAGILRLKPRSNSREPARGNTPETWQNLENTSAYMHSRSPEAGHATLEQIFLQPGEEVTLPQAVYSRGIRIVTQPRPINPPYEQESDHSDYYSNHVARVFDMVTPLKTARILSSRFSTGRSAATASVVSTATIESMESMGPTASTGSTTSMRLRDLTVEQNRSQALFDLSQNEDSLSVRQNRSEAPFDVTQWDDGFDQVRQPFWERSLAVVGLTNYGRRPGEKRDKNTNFAGKSKLQAPPPTTKNTGAPALPVSPLWVRNGRDESLHARYSDVSSLDEDAQSRAKSDEEFVTVALDSPRLGMSSEEMEQARLTEERRRMDKRRTDGYGRFERLRSVLPHAMDGQGPQNPYHW